MKKKIVIAGFLATFAGFSFAALDATLLQNAQLLSVQEPATDRTETELVAAQNFTTNATVVSTGLPVANYFGKGEIVLAFSGNADAAYTNVATIVQGPSAVALTNVVATIAHGGNAIALRTYEIDFSTLTQSHWGVSFAGETDNAAAYRFAAKAVTRSIPSAAQTVTGSAVDKMPFTGTANIVVSVGPGKEGSSTFATTVRIQSADTSNGSYTNVAGMATTITGASGGIATIPYDTTGGKRYIRAVATTTNDVAPLSVIINSFK